ncbi:threonylcarbamoyl-AMP synthase [Pontibacter diazotrophicus]|uniref:Threonylcarbamoyl-AMP synthase n=2 Tax=Pontibacter diazotrophicus TaxID=1400979 RepID=A0A3D8L384_9BACT|nr:threonylcarbamoyl-AMP synthase [Pontibacter diazotrophicus]
MAAIGQNIQRASRLLSGGKLVAIPTETVYGLAANALDALAVEQIFSVKNRPHFNPLIIHIGSSNELIKYVTEVPAAAQRLIEKFWPGPLTLLLPKKENVPDIVTASLPHVAVRVPDHPLTLKLLQMLEFPLAAPSANPFCYISPTRPEHVQQQIGEKIPYILDGGPCDKGVESTIVGFENNKPVVFRLGAITPEEIEEVAGEVKVHKQTGRSLLSPGMLPYHYSPRTPLYLTDRVEELLEKYGAAETGIITFHKTMDNLPQEHLAVLSPTANMSQAASNLYHSLHRLDGMNLKRIIAEKLPEKGLGKTINERLKKAAGRIVAES